MNKRQYISPTVYTVGLPEHLMLAGASDRDQQGNTNESLNADEESGGGSVGSPVIGDAKSWSWDDDFLAGLEW